MKTKINIAEILKDKPVNTKLYSPLYGDVYFSYIGVRNNISVLHHRFTLSDFLYNGRYTAYKESEIMLFPSKDMRDWRKFAWKKGDVLFSEDDVFIIFEEFENDAYTRFKGKHYLWKEYNEEDYSKEETKMLTSKFEKANDNDAQTYINTIEERLGGKLNRKTLEVEKAQPEFKDGDIVCISGMGYLAYGIVKSIDNSSKKLEYYVLNDMSTLKIDDWLSFEDKQIQPITETQRIILFDALAKNTMAWDAEKKEIVDLKPKVELKPFDKVLCRNSKDDTWEADFFARLTRKEIDYTQSGKYLCVGDLWMYCIPYNEETAHLLGTTDEWKGGEQ